MARFACALLMAAWGGPSPAAASPGDESPAENAFFESRIRPVLATQCYSCHSAQAQKVKGGLRLDSRDAMIKGGDSGPALVPGKPDQSRLVQAVRWANKDLQMPQKTKLPEAAIGDLETWVKAGAPWPRDARPAAGVVGEYERLRKEHWAWQPLRPRAPGSDIDRLVLAKLGEAALKPVEPADRASLLRRAAFDLVGLPPTPEEIQAFVSDSSPDAFEKVVDRLLGSRGFGERWGRHWLDVVRYAESTGSARNVAYPNAWRYRDYVIASLNADKPYDRFIREQVAGDLLTATSPEQRDELSIATGFLALGVKDLNEKNHEQFVMDCIDDQIDVTSRAFLALTASCARCHDHKFDPVPTIDYYALAGIFKSTVEMAGVHGRGKGGGRDYVDDDLLIPLGAKTPATAAPPEAKKGRKGKKPKAEEPAPAEKPLAMGVRDGTPVDARICLHGEVEHLGATVARGVPSLIRIPGATTVDPKSSGRLQLAAWLSDRANPLTARVMANRVWSHLFGQGLVATVDNFGSTGERPSHPELLDHLAARFVEQGWSVKKLIREIALSETYRRGGEARAENMAIDPANRLLWRSPPRRLDAEALRDAILAVSGQLDASPGAGSPVAHLSGLVAPKNGRGFEPEEMRHRSVYLPIVRDGVPDFLHAFDFADPSSIAGSRDVTTVATQALLLMNSPFVTSQARLWAEKLVASKAADDAARIGAAYRAALGRPPSPAEGERVQKYLGARPDPKAWSGFCQALFESAEFRYLGVPAPTGKETSHVR